MIENGASKAVLTVEVLMLRRHDAMRNCLIFDGVAIGLRICAGARESRQFNRREIRSAGTMHRARKKTHRSGEPEASEPSQHLLRAVREEDNSDSQGPGQSSLGGARFQV
jgi:hypothetical protein